MTVIKDVESLVVSLFCISIVCVLLFGVALQKKSGMKQKKQFLLLVCATMLFLLIDMCSWIVEGKKELELLLIILDLGVFYAIDLILLAFTVYLRAFMNTAKEGAYKLLYIIDVSVAVRVATITALFATGNLFVIENGVYNELDLCTVPYIFGAAIMGEMVLAVLFYRKCFTRMQLGVILIYIILPIPLIVLEMYTGVYVLTGMALTLSLLIVYVLLQATTVEQAQIRADILEELSSTDLLTKLGNRRAFYQRTSELPPEQSVGVCFCDINGLKYANDHFGHAVGDELLKKFARILTENFRKEDIFRISGDEFVVLVRGTTEQDFLSHVHRFFNIVCDENRIAAIGHSFGACSCVERLVSDAEEAMYEDKRICGKSRNSVTNID